MNWLFKKNIDKYTFHCCVYFLSSSFFLGFTSESLLLVLLVSLAAAPSLEGVSFFKLPTAWRIASDCGSTPKNYTQFIKMFYLLFEQITLIHNSKIREEFTFRFTEKFS